MGLVMENSTRVGEAFPIPRICSLPSGGRLYWQYPYDTEGHDYAYLDGRFRRSRGCLMAPRPAPGHGVNLPVSLLTPSNLYRNDSGFKNEIMTTQANTDLPERKALMRSLAHDDDATFAASLMCHYWSMFPSLKPSDRLRHQTALSILGLTQRGEFSLTAVLRLLHDHDNARDGWSNND